MIRLLLVEDDLTIAQIIRYYLVQTEEYEVVSVRNAGEAVGVANQHFDVILLDIMLPDVDGVSLCAKLREWHACPIIFISCIEDSDIVVRALEMGGDDYLVKPFDNKVLNARIKANLRRVALEHTPKCENRFQCDAFAVEPKTKTLVKNGRTVPLGNMEYRILTFLMMNPGAYFPASELYRRIWEKPSYGDVRTVQVHIYNLRQKIEADPANPLYLRSAWGKGYLFDPKGGKP